MRYMMKKKLFSLGADFTIKDSSGNDAFFVDGKVFTLPRSTHLPGHARQ